MQPTTYDRVMLAVKPGSQYDTGAYVASVKPGSPGAYVASVKPGSQYDTGAYVASVKPGSQYDTGAIHSVSFTLQQNRT